jgi:hypothetical protein
MDQQDALFTFSYISINNLYMFQAGLLLIIRKYYSVYTAVYTKLYWGNLRETLNLEDPGVEGRIIKAGSSGSGTWKHGLDRVGSR